MRTRVGGAPPASRGRVTSRAMSPRPVGDRRARRATSRLLSAHAVVVPGDDGVVRRSARGRCRSPRVRSCTGGERTVAVALGRDLTGQNGVPSQRIAARRGERAEELHLDGRRRAAEPATLMRSEIREPGRTTSCETTVVTAALRRDERRLGGLAAGGRGTAALASVARIDSR